MKHNTPMDRRNLVLYALFLLVGLNYANQTFALISLADQFGIAYARIGFACSLGMALVCSPLLLFRRLLGITLGLLLSLALLPIHIFLINETFLTPLTPQKIFVDGLLTVGYYYIIIESLILVFRARKTAVFQLPSNTMDRLNTRLILSLLPTLVFIIVLTIRL